MKKRTQIGRLGKLRAKTAHARISENEWDFDNSRVDDAELLACCYWEYARESDSIRETVQKLKEVDAGKGSRTPEGGASHD